MRKLNVSFIGIENQRCGAYQSVLDGRTVDRNGLNGRSGRSCGAGGSVESVAYLLFARAAGESLDLAGVLVNDDDAALKLRLCAVLSLGQLVKIGVDRIDLCLNVLIYAGIDLVACIVNELACRNAADALCLGKVGDNVGEHDFFVVAVDAGGVGRIFAADKLKLLIYGLFILGFVKIALLIHLAKDVFLTFLIILNAVERVVVRRQIRYADNGSGFGNGKILCVLTEVGLCRRLHAVAALAEIHGVEIPFENLFLIVLLLEVQRLEYLQKLSLHGDVVLLGEVFDKLLGYRRAAEGGTAGEHIKCSVRRAEPVNALMRVKALVLNGDERILHVLRDLIPVHPDAVFAAADGRQLLIIPV